MQSGHCFIPKSESGVVLHPERSRAEGAEPRQQLEGMSETPLVQVWFTDQQHGLHRDSEAQVPPQSCGVSIWGSHDLQVFVHTVTLEMPAIITYHSWGHLLQRRLTVLVVSSSVPVQWLHRCIVLPRTLNISQMSTRLI